MDNMHIVFLKRFLWKRILVCCRQFFCRQIRK